MVPVHPSGTSARRRGSTRALPRGERSAESPNPRIITFDSGWAGIFGYLLVIWSVPALAWWGMLGADWQNAGLLQAGLVSQGEWWRAVTALTLHSSFAHLVANSLFGAVFGLMAGRYLGSGSPGS